MSLQPTRHVPPVTIKDFPEAAEFGIAPAQSSIEQWFWDHPRLQLSLLLKEIVVITRASDGAVAHRDTNEWIFDQPTRFPILARKTTEGLAYVPGVSNRSSPVRIGLEETAYWYEDYIVGGPYPSTRTEKWAWVIYDMTKAAYSPSDAAPALAAQGRKIPTAPSRNVVDSARKVTVATEQSAVVEKPDANQVAKWQPVSIEIKRVVKDMQRYITVTWTHDYLSGVDSIKREERLENPLAFEVPYELPAPHLEGFEAGAAGVELEVRGGNAKVPVIWPVEATQDIPPKSYVFYRRVVTAAGDPANGDPYGLYLTPPGVPGNLPLEHTSVKDYAGVAADPLPAQTPYSEGEDNSIPPAEVWEQIAEVANVETVPSAEGHATYLDTGVVAGETYAYFAVARRDEVASADSNIVQVAYSGPLVAYGIEVKAKDGTGEALAPADTSGLGETKAVDVGYSGDDVASLMADLAPRQFNAGRNPLSCSIGMTTPLLIWERGQRCTIPAVAWETWGNGLHLTTNVAQLEWRIEGFGLRASRGADGGPLAVVAEDLQVEALP